MSIGAGAMVAEMEARSLHAAMSAERTREVAKNVAKGRRS